MRINKEFLVFRKSKNTNSFGLFQVYLMAKDGETYISCASQYNVKPVGTIINGKYFFNEQTLKRVGNCSFIGHELIERLSLYAPNDVIEEVWKLEL